MRRVAHGEAYFGDKTPLILQLMLKVKTQQDEARRPSKIFQSW